MLLTTCKERFLGRWKSKKSRGTYLALSTKVIDNSYCITINEYWNITSTDKTGQCCFYQHIWVSYNRNKMTTHKGLRKNIFQRGKKKTSANFPHKHFIQSNKQMIMPHKKQQQSRSNNFITVIIATIITMQNRPQRHNYVRRNTAV